MAKKKKSGGGGGCGQQPKPAEEEAEDKAVGDHADESCDKNKDKADNGKKAAPPLPVVTAVLKVDMHCDGCTKRIRASVRHYPGVEGVAMDVDKGTMTVVGRVDAKKLRDRVAGKTKKKVELVVVNQNKGKDDDEEAAACNKKQQQNPPDFKVQHHECSNKPDCIMYDLYWLDNKVYGAGCKLPDNKAMHDHHAKQADKDKLPNKEDKACGGGGGGGGGKAKEDNKDDKGSCGGGGKGKDDNKSCGGGGGDKGKGGKDNKKPGVPVVGTVVLKIGAVGLHCDGCINRVRAKLFKIKGVEQVSMDTGKNQVTVTGTMDTKALPGKLQKKLRRPVDVVASANNKDKEKKEKDGNNNKQEGGCKDGSKQEAGCKDKDAATKTLTTTAEMLMWKTAFYDQYPLLSTEFMLSDENPNACSVM